MNVEELGLTRDEELIRLIENCKMALSGIGSRDKDEVARLVEYSIELDRLKRNGRGTGRSIGR